MIGSRPMTDPMLIIAWPSSHAMIPPVAMRVNVSRVPAITR